MVFLSSEMSIIHFEAVLRRILFVLFRVTGRMISLIGKRVIERLLPVHPSKCQKPKQILNFTLQYNEVVTDQLLHVSQLNNKAFLNWQVRF